MYHHLLEHETKHLTDKMERGRHEYLQSIKKLDTP